MLESTDWYGTVGRSLRLCYKGTVGFATLPPTVGAKSGANERRYLSILQTQQTHVKNTWKQCLFIVQTHTVQKRKTLQCSMVDFLFYRFCNPKDGLFFVQTCKRKTLQCSMFNFLCYRFCHSRKKYVVCRWGYLSILQTQRPHVKNTWKQYWEMLTTKYIRDSWRRGNSTHVQNKVSFLQ